MELKFDVYAKIAQPVAVVFSAIADPQELSAYFTTGAASGPLREGARARRSTGNSAGSRAYIR